MTMTMTTKQDLINRINRLSKEYDALIKRHGHGVRSSYVSADLGHLSCRIARAQEQIKLLDIESPCDEWSGVFGEEKL